MAMNTRVKHKEKSMKDIFKIKRFNSENGHFYHESYIETPGAMTFNLVSKIVDDEPKAVITTINMIIGTDKYTLDGIEEFVEFVNSYNFDAAKKVIIFCTGLDVFYEFIKNELVCTTFSPRDKGIALCTIGYLEFREIKTIAGDDWCKLVSGDTPIEKAWLFANFYYENILVRKGEVLAKAPLTTQQVIQEQIKSGASQEYKDLVKEMMPKTSRFYSKLMEKVYMGGFCDKNPNYYNEEGWPILDIRREKVGHVDFKTSYISRMLTDYFPITRFEKSKDPENDLVEAIKTKCCLIQVKLTNFNAIDTVRFLAKKRAIFIYGEKVNSCDKILHADEVTFMLTELDFELMTMFYSYDAMVIEELYTSTKGELPYEIRRVAHTHYFNKENLEKYSANQLWEKLLTEIIYGACCKKLYGLEDKAWHDIVEQAILSPYWGIWTTSHARYALLTMVKLLGNDFLYSDTDSIYFRNPYLHVQLIEKYNANVIAKNKLYVYEHRYESLLLRNEAFIKLGTFTYEDGATPDHFTITDFISSGPKSYIKALEDGTIITKVAGYKKQYNINGKLETAWLRDYQDKDELFDAFANPNTVIKDKFIQKIFIGPCELEVNGKLYKVKSGVFVGTRDVYMTRTEMLNFLAEQDAEYEEKCVKNGRERR